MTIYQIEAFLTLASTLNYTKASSVLHTAQPNLSKIIITMEQEMEVQLFTRSKRGVKLTPAGVTFQQGMSEVMQQYEETIQKMKDVDSGIKGSIDVGFLGTALVHKLPEVVNSFRERHPDIILNLIDYTYSGLVEALSDDKIDIALIPDRELEHLPKYSRKLLFTDDMCLVVNCNHPIAINKTIDLSMVTDEPFVVMDPKVSIRDYDLVTSLCAEQAFTPQIAYEANTLNNLLMMVECGVGISILASHMKHFATDNVAFINIRGYSKYFHMSSVWNKKDNSCAVHFLNILHEHFLDE